MRSVSTALLLAALTASQAVAQHVSVAGGFAMADYREQAAFLHFQGVGPAASVLAEKGRLSLRIDGTHLDLNPSGDNSAALESFTLDQLSVRAGFRAMSLVALEAGYVRRATSPSRAAQSYSAATFGVRAAYPLAPGADVALRTAYVAGTDFTGGGSAPFGLELGLSAAYGPGAGRFRLMGDFEFQRIDRHTEQDGTSLSVPIQSSIARLGVGVRF